MSTTYKFLDLWLDFLILVACLWYLFKGFSVLSLSQRTYTDISMSSSSNITYVDEGAITLSYEDLIGYILGYDTPDIVYEGVRYQLGKQMIFAEQIHSGEFFRLERIYQTGNYSTPYELRVEKIE